MATSESITELTDSSRMVSLPQKRITHLHLACDTVNALASVKGSFNFSQSNLVTIIYRAGVKGGSQAAWMLQASWGRSGKQQQEDFHQTWPKPFSHAIRATFLEVGEFLTKHYNSCCRLPLLPRLACSIHANWPKPFIQPLYKRVSVNSNRSIPICGTVPSFLLPFFLRLSIVR